MQRLAFFEISPSICLVAIILLLGYFNPLNARTHFVKHVRDACNVIKNVNSAKSLAEKGELDTTDSAEGGILTKNQIEATYGRETWQRRVYEDLVSVLLSQELGKKTFPCVYASKGYKSNDQRYVFIHSDDSSEPRNVRLIGKALRTYLPLSRTYGPNTTLVILSPPNPEERSVEQYNLDFWGLLRGLRVLDTKPWPEDIPVGTRSNRWAFCFDGVPWFLAVLTPSHSKRRSRYAPNLVIVLQPKWVFDILFSTPKKRHGACEKVRALVSEYDDIPLSPDIAHHGEEDTSESRQYFLLDENQRSYCPYEDLV